MAKFDIIWPAECGPTIDYHFCREWNEKGGCYGTNPDHGYTLEEAARQVAEWHLEQYHLYISGCHPSLERFKNDGH